MALGSDNGYVNKMRQQLFSVQVDHPIGVRIGFELLWKGRMQQAFAFRRADGSWAACVNRCKHWAEPLDAESPTVYAEAQDQIVCSLHGARFDSHSGFCVGGPCHGASLDMIPVFWEDGFLYQI